jgi:hypothetical protein
LATFAFREGRLGDGFGGVFDMETEDYGDLAPLRSISEKLKAASDELQRLRTTAGRRSERAFYYEGLEDESHRVHSVLTEYDLARERLMLAIVSINHLMADEIAQHAPVVTIRPIE